MRREQGLSSQNFRCLTCSAPVGVCESSLTFNHLSIHLFSSIHSPILIHPSTHLHPSIHPSSSIHSPILIHLSPHLHPSIHPFLSTHLHPPIFILSLIITIDPFTFTPTHSPTTLVRLPERGGMCLQQGLLLQRLHGSPLATPRLQGPLQLGFQPLRWCGGVLSCGVLWWCAVVWWLVYCSDTGGGVVW